MNEQAYSILMGILIGDAVGYPVDSLGKGHIRSTLGALSGFADPAGALKGHIERWRKPGLLSASGQLLLCAAAAARGRELSAASCASLIASNGEGGAAGTGPFRTTSRLLRVFLSNAYGREVAAGPSASAAVLPVCAGGAVTVAVNRTLDGGECLSFAAGFGADADSAIASELLGRVLAACVNGAGFPDLTVFSRTGEELAVWCAENEPLLFSAGFNPVAAVSSARELAAIFRSLEECSSAEAGEKLIVEAVNRRLKTPVTRATVDHPFAVLPYAALLAGLYRGVPSTALFRAGEEGGASSALCALVGAFICSEADPLELYGPLFQSLVNRRELVSCAEKIASGTFAPREIAAFLSSESALSSKENEEREARMKHGKVSAPPKKKDRREQERSLTRHVVESWTKADKARWKKERRNMEKDSED